jgi:hypothetical protein
MSDPTSSMPSSWLAMAAKIDPRREPDRRQFLLQFGMTFQASWYSFLIRATAARGYSKTQAWQRRFPIFRERR